MLEIQIQRAIGVVLERHPAADGKAVEFVANLEAFRVIQGDRPERIDRRLRALVEMQHVVVGTVEGLPLVVPQVQRIDRILRQVSPQPDLRDDGALEVVVAINPHGVSVH
ncbi:hypothetical protein D3C84_750870 [compost metagenome]